MYWVGSGSGSAPGPAFLCKPCVNKFKSTEYMYWVGSGSGSAPGPAFLCKPCVNKFKSTEYVLGGFGIWIRPWACIPV